MKATTIDLTSVSVGEFRQILQGDPNATLAQALDALRSHDSDRLEREHIDDAHRKYLASRAERRNTVISVAVNKALDKLEAEAAGRGNAGFRRFRNMAVGPVASPGERAFVAQEASQDAGQAFDRLHPELLDLGEWIAAGSPAEFGANTIKRTIKELVS